MKVVLDTNILVSAFIVDGVCSGLLDDCISNRRITIILSMSILNEFRNTLTRKFRHGSEEIRTRVGALLEASEIVEPVIFETQVCRDADDDAILGTAVAGNADCIVTGDSDLLVLERFQDVDIISPSEFAQYEVGRA